MERPDRIPWRESNLALIGSDLDRKIKEAAAAGEDAWEGVGQKGETKVWRIEQFKVVPWPESKYGMFHKGDSYIVLHSYTKEDSDALLHDIHFWIGSESSQDEYGTAAYKTVELDDLLGGTPVQYREVQGSESPLFVSYFGNLTYLDGGVDSGFEHVEASKEEPHLYKIKGTSKGMSMTQVPLSKSSLNQGDSFILFANASLVWVWQGESSNQDENAKAISAAEKMCTEGTVVVLESSATEGDHPEFWAYLGNGDINPAEGGDDEVEAFVPVLYRMTEDGSTEKIAEAEPSKVRWGPPTSQLDRSLLNDGCVFLLDVGFEVYLWMGSSSPKDVKLGGMQNADNYIKSKGLGDVPLSLVKSGWESSDFNQYFE